MNNRGQTIPYIPIIIVVVGILTLIFGWKTLIYVVGLFLGVGLCTWIYDKITGGPQEVIEEADIAVAHEAENEASVPADAPILLEVKVEEAASADTPVSEEEPSVDDTSGAAEFLGCVGFLGAILACYFLPPLMLVLLGPWWGIVASIVCASLWIKFGPPPFPGLLPGCLSIIIPANALAVIAISLHKLISG